MKYVIHVFGDTPRITVPNSRPGDEVTVVLEPGSRLGQLPGEVVIPRINAKAFVVDGGKVLTLGHP